MAKVAAAYTTYDSRANRENLSAVISNIDPVETPVFTALSRRNVTNRTFDWQTEELPAPDANNAHQEGFANVNSEATPTQRLTNVAQISKRDATVSGSQEASDAAGKRSEMGHQMALCAKALKRDVEVILCSAQPRADGDDDTPTARKTRGLAHWIAGANASFGAGGAAPASATAPLTAGTPRAFDEERLLDLLQQAYTNGAEPDLMVMGPAVKRMFSKFVGRDGNHTEIDAKTVSSAVEIFISDFGTIKAVPSRFVGTDMALLLDADYAKVAMFRPFKTVDLAKIGDAETKMIVAEWGVECTNPKAHAAYFNIGADPGI